MTQQDYTSREHVRIWYDNHILDRLIAVEKAVGLFPPKPLKLKKVALDCVKRFEAGQDKLGDLDIIRQALEQLPDNE